MIKLRKQEKIFLSSVSTNTPIKDPESITHKKKKIKIKTCSSKDNV